MQRTSLLVALYVAATIISVSCGGWEREGHSGGGHRFLLVAPTNARRYPLLRHGAETWRVGIRSLFVINGTEEKQIDPPEELGGDDRKHETWWSFPDAFSFPDPHRGEGTLGVHEMRYVASVRIANKSLGGTFDWLLLGDDDTVWFLDQVRDLLEGLDSSVPFLLADSLGGCCAEREGPGTFDCYDLETQTLACSLPEPGQPAAPPEGAGAAAGGGTCHKHPPLAPCLASALRDPSVTCPTSFRPWHGFPENEPKGVVWALGDTGMILSRGLLEAIPEETWRDCKLCRTNAERIPGKGGVVNCGAGGDVRIGQCVWHAGFGPTMPFASPDSSNWGQCVFGKRRSVAGWTTLLDAGLSWAGLAPRTPLTKRFSQGCVRQLRASVTTGTGVLKDMNDDAIAAGLRELVRKRRQLEHLIGRAGNDNEAAARGGLRKPKTAEDPPGESNGCYL